MIGILLDGMLVIYYVANRYPNRGYLGRVGKFIKRVSSQSPFWKKLLYSVLYNDVEV